MKRNRRAFLIPDTKAFISGGNLYNRHLIDALCARGHTIYESAQLEQLPEESPLLVDTLLAPDLPASAARRAGLIVHHLKSLYPPSGWTGEGWFREKEWPWLQHFGWYLATSPFTESYLREKGIQKPIEVVEPGLSGLPALTTKPASPIQAVVVANLVARKGILPLLKAWKAHPPPGAQLRIIGSREMAPDYADKCLQWVDTLPAVSYLGALGQGATLAQYAQSNLLISAAYMETYGMALQEAAAAGLPILAYNGGNAPYHVAPGKNGELCQSHTEILSWLGRWAAQPADFEPYLQAARALAPQRQRLWPDAAAQFEAINIPR